MYNISDLFFFGVWGGGRLKKDKKAVGPAPVSVVVVGGGVQRVREGGRKVPKTIFPWRIDHGELYIYHVGNIQLTVDRQTHLQLS